MLITSVGFYTINSYAAEANDGLDFLNEAPSEKTEYYGGTVVYEPLQDGSSVITLNNAVLHANKNVKYWDVVSNVDTALAGTGDVTLVIKGENKIYLSTGGSSTGLFFYDSNVTIEGDGSLFVGFETPEGSNSGACAMYVMGNNDVLNGAEGVYTDSGNLTIKSGTVVLNCKRSRTKGSLMVSNDIKVEGGKLTVEGQTNAIYSVYHNIIISGGEVNCSNYSMYGLYSRRGDIFISGEDTVVNIDCSARPVRTVGMSAGNMSYSAINLDEAGKIVISGGKIDIVTDFIGIFAQYIDGIEDSGTITITGGDIDITGNGETDVVAGIYAQGDEGSVKISGGNIGISAKNQTDEENVEDTYAIGIYADNTIAMSGGNISAEAEGNSGIVAVAVSAVKKLSLYGGEAVLKGTTMATDAIPEISGDRELIASASIDGTDAAEFNPDKLSTYKYIRLQQKQTVESVEVSAEKDTVKYGESLQLNFKVSGTNVDNTGVVWSISGATSANTKISADGLLTIGEDEKATSITVTAASEVDPSVKGTFVIELKADEGENPGEVPETPEEPTETPEGLPAVAITFIVIGCVLVVAVAVFGIIYFVKRNKKSDN